MNKMKIHLHQTCVKVHAELDFFVVLTSGSHVLFACVVVVIVTVFKFSYKKQDLLRRNRVSVMLDSSR